MALKRMCRAVTGAGSPCRQAPQVDGDLCFWHDPSNEKEAAEARRLGGLNRRRDATLQEVYDVEGLETVADLRRILHIALMGELGLENSHNKSRTLIAVVTTAARLHEVGELEARVEEIEGVLGQRPQPEREKGKRWWSR